MKVGSNPAQDIIYLSSLKFLYSFGKELVNCMYAVKKLMATTPHINLSTDNGNDHQLPTVHDCTYNKRLCASQ